MQILKVCVENSPMYNILERSIVEAERFIKKAKEAQQVLIDDKWAWARSKETASAKRASMDLTRELVNVRK